MPGSSRDGKAWIVERLMDEMPSRVLDIGAGCGTYAQLFRARWPGSHWTAVEVWEPYIAMYKLREQYDVVIIADARTWEPGEGRYGVAFLGDVLEHMTREEARALLDRMRAVADIVVVSIPIIHYPQGPLFGNPHEIHVEEDWTHAKVCEQLGPPTECLLDGVIGAYIYRQSPGAVEVPVVPETRPKVKVAIYAIAKNEAACAARWAKSAKDADCLVVADTGSTDGTQEILRAAGVKVYDIAVVPWRFDVARNTSMALIPGDMDYCIALDLDETISAGWREALEDAKARGLTRPRYRYVWSWTADGQPNKVYRGDKINARAGFRWRHPVHEVMAAYGAPEKQGDVAMEIQHHPVPGNGARDDLPLLALSVKEDPNDDRNAHYHARELFYRQKYPEAAAEFKRHLALPSATWKPERASSMRFLAKCEPSRKLDWLLRAALEAPGLREPWVELAVEYRHRKAWGSCYAAALSALSITKRELLYLTESYAWGRAPHDEAALAAHYMGMKDEAIRHGKAALELEPNDQRLRLNLAFYEKGLGG